MKRRNFLKLLLGTSGLVVSSCSVQTPPEKLIPYLVPPEEPFVPGEPVFYRTTCAECPAHCGIEAKCYDKVYKGQNKLFPVKLEGVKEHPQNDGALCLRGQVSLARFYHPDRLKFPLLKNEQGQFKQIRWDDAYETLRMNLKVSQEKGKTSVFLSSRTTGTLSELIETFCKTLNIQRLPEFEFFSYANLRKAYEILFQKYAVPHYKVEECDFLLTLGADLFETFINPVSFARQLIKANKQKDFSHFHLEPHLSLTGLSADKRFTLVPGSEIYLLLFLLNEALKESPGFPVSVPSVSLEEVSQKTNLSTKQLMQISMRLAAAKKPLLITGGVCLSQPSGLEAAVLSGLIQWVRGMINKQVDFTSYANLDHAGTLLDIKKLCTRLERNDIGVILLSRVNPEPVVPASFHFTERLKKALFKVCLSDFHNETAKECDLILPLSHAFELYGDAEPRKGVISLFQPVLEPFYNTKGEGDILLGLLQKPFTFREHLFKKWKEKYGTENVQKLLKDGYLEQHLPKVNVQLQGEKVVSFIKGLKMPRPLKTPVLLSLPSLRTFDGRSSALPLTQEIPDPITTISYGKWVSVSNHEAEKEGWEDKDELVISGNGFHEQLPAKVQPQLSDHVYVIYAPALFQIDGRTGEGFCFVENARVTKTGKKIVLPILSGTTLQSLKDVTFEPHHKEDPHGGKRSFYPEHEHKDYRWVMAIDLDACTGCSACVAACYIENNIPVTSEKDHLKDREMSWLHVELFYERDKTTHFLPMMCQQCDNAPCEPVCPVYATYHNPEGLNAQIYNRCVGTRYCENNCPYKARRFDWWDYPRPEPLNLMTNPEVFVRTKGVTEKCTFCVQRVRMAKDKAKDENRKVLDGEVIPACAQTCPSRAIVFGNILDENSEVYKLARSSRAFRILEHLNAEPSVYYLKKGKKA